ncbi:MAG: hypothetical protein ACRDLF_10465 [Solirubrobacteraceae bacterium]
MARRRLATAAATLALSLLLSGVLLAKGLAGEPGPLVQQGAKLTAGEESGEGRFGRSVAISADGDTALIGGPRTSGEAGAVWVFARTGSTWTQQAKLVGGEESEAGHFGRSVALSADGDTALIGGPNDDGVGAAWVFTRSGSTWTQQAKLTGAGESGSGWFGQSVALSADGKTALVGGFVDHSDTGAAWVFARLGSAWTQQGEKLTGGGESGEGAFGWSVALSAAGDTALIGARRDGGGAGAAWVFARSGSTWTQQGEKLTGGEASGAGELGQSVALSADGDTALVGGFHDGEGAGAAWVFARSGATWTQQGGKLTGGGEAGEGYFGDAVALTPDGSTALVGGFRDDEHRGAAWVFARSGSTWTQQGEKLTGGEASGRSEFGWSVALSSDGATALIGGIGDTAKAGAAWVFGPPQPALGGTGPPGGATSPGGATPSGGATLPNTLTQSPATISPDPNPAARQGVAAYRAAGGGVVLVGRRLLVRHGRTKVKLRCTAPVTCRGSLTLVLVARAKAARRSGKVTIARARFSIRHGATAIVKLTLTVAGRSRVGAGRVRLGASLTLHLVAPGPPGTQTYAVKLVARKPHRPSK